MRTQLFLVLVGLAAGCAKDPSQLNDERFFREWLRSHKETNVVVDADGVGIAKNATRMKASLYESKKQNDGSYIVETEFRIKLPNDKVIVEFVAGIGKTEQEAVEETFLNFVLTTMHVIYKSFMNPADEHQGVDKITVNGVERELLMGDVFMRGMEEQQRENLDAMRSSFQALVSAMPLDRNPHWIKIVYGQNNNEVITISVTLDNEDAPAATMAAKTLPWPKSDGFYLMKQFIVVK